MRWKLRTLIGLIFCIAVVLAIFTNRARMIAAARHELVRAGAEVDFEHQIKSKGPFSPEVDRDAKAPIANFVPASLHWLFPQPIYRVQFNATKMMQRSNKEPVSNSCIRILSDAGPIRELTIFDGSNLADEAFGRFANMLQLEDLSISVRDGFLSNEGFEQICRAPRLESINITGGKMDGNALRFLSGTSIDTLMLENTGITDQELQEFAVQNPNVEVWIQGQSSR